MHVLRLACVVRGILVALQMLLATTGAGLVVPLLISGSGEQGGIAAAPLPSTSTEQAINWPCWFSSSSPTSGVTNTGGTGECTAAKSEVLATR
jgi:hypothetical protein